MPNYNNAPYLGDCIESILKQSYSDFELLIVDDGSNDDSVDVIHGFKDHRIRLICQENNGGIVQALNRGLKEINTEYFVRHDGDDIMHADRIKVLVDFMDRNPQIGVCSSDISTFGAADEKIIFERDVEVNRANLVFGHSIGHASSIFRTSIFRQHQIFYSDQYPFLEDYDLFYQLKDKTNTTSIEGFLYFYRVLERHNHAFQVAKKSGTFKAFYKRVLVDLGMEPNDTNISLHFELAKSVEPTFKLDQYRRYVGGLKAANVKSNCFPTNEFNRVIEKKYIRVIYRMIVSKSLNVFQVFYLSVVKWKPFIKFWIAEKMKLNQRSE